MTTIVGLTGIHTDLGEPCIAAFSDTAYSKDNGTVGNIEKVFTGKNYLVTCCGNMAVREPIRAWVEGMESFPEDSPHQSQLIWLTNFMNCIIKAGLLSSESSNAVIVTTFKGNFTFSKGLITKEEEVAAMGTGGRFFDTVYHPDVTVSEDRKAGGILFEKIPRSMRTARACFLHAVMRDKHSSGSTGFMIIKPKNELKPLFK